ncbi:hypothetical protein [Caulobacter henricii]|uniref:Uncharacterized protein n=1 Tax=Caulobacter henricii TaxID=69395 RepID=A0A0P0NWG3_9CAUL|nr:hypothetical protein [Caulobacter henricii]ALL12383.1 hypothetical protein AQ619_02855 [Caulobacter henricii]
MSFQSKSVTLAFSLAVLAAQSGCDKLPGAAKPPAEAAQPVAPATAAATPEPAQASEGTDPDAGNWRKDEAKLLKSIGQPEARQGQTLTLRRNGIIVLTKTDDADGYYLLSNVLQVPTVNGVQTVYELSTFSKEESASQDEPYTEFYDERGNFIEAYDGFGQWRGAMFAISRAEETWSVGDDGRVSTQLLDWSSKPHRKFDFKSRCQPKEWVSDTEIKGVCTRPTRVDGSENVGEEEIDAVYTRVGPNSWRLRELRAPKGKMKDFDNNPPTAYDETVKGVAYSGG